MSLTGSALSSSFNSNNFVCIAATLAVLKGSVVFYLKRHVEKSKLYLKVFLRTTGIIFGWATGAGAAAGGIPEYLDAPVNGSMN